MKKCPPPLPLKEVRQDYPSFLKESTGCHKMVLGRLSPSPKGKGHFVQFIRLKVKKGAESGALLLHFTFMHQCATLALKAEGALRPTKLKAKDA